MIFCYIWIPVNSWDVSLKCFTMRFANLGRLLYVQLWMKPLEISGIHIMWWTLDEIFHASRWSALGCGCTHDYFQKNMTLS